MTAPATETTARARAEALLAAMTLEEKAALTAGTVAEDPPAVGVVAGVERLGVPPVWMQDGPQDVHNWLDPVPGATQFPSQLTAGATWDPSLVRRFGAALGEEMRAKGMDVALAPILDVAREPTWGRHFETYGEDPHHVGVLGAAEVEGIQSRGVLACVKHFATNAQEADRKSVDVRVGERALREVYLRPFEHVVRTARPATVMSAYNRVNGEHASCAGELLHEVLKEEWGFDGWVMTDWDATEPYRDPVPLAEAGLDQEMPRPWAFGPALAEAVRAGRLPEAVLDGMARRILTTMARFGLLDRPRAGDASTPATGPVHAALSRRLTEEGSVLLRNTPVGGAAVLPLRGEWTVAVVGPAAGPAPRAGGLDPFSRTPYHVTVREGLAARGAKVTYAQGLLPPGQAPAVPCGRVTAEYFRGEDQSGEPALTRPEEGVDLDTKNRPPVSGLPRATWSGRWRGTLRAPVTGTYTLALRASGGGARLRVGGELLIDGWEEVYGAAGNAEVTLTAGEAVPFEVGFAKRSPSSAVRLGWYPGTAADALAEAVEAARAADAVVVVAADDGGEERDRTGLELPHGQDGLIASVAAANPRTVVVLTTGGPVTMPWLEDVPAVLAAWQPGQEAGAAIARVLYGDAEPGGRLPVTFPASRDQTPAADPHRFGGVGGVVRFDEGLEVGHRAHHARGTRPLFPFGHGLSYTTFALSDLRVAAGREVSVTVTDTGGRAGSEVVQLYVTHPAGAGEPPRRLVGFAKVRLAPGASRTVRLPLTDTELRVWDEARGTWRVPPGTYLLEAGRSSTDLPLRTELEVP